jgi:hypothetical protein
MKTTRFRRMDVSVDRCTLESTPYLSPFLNMYDKGRSYTYMLYIL